MSQATLEKAISEGGFEVHRRTDRPPFVTVRSAGLVSLADPRDSYAVHLAVSADHPIDEPMRKLFNHLRGLTGFALMGPPSIAIDAVPPGSSGTDLYDVATFVMESRSILAVA